MAQPETSNCSSTTYFKMQLHTEKRSDQHGIWAGQVQLIYCCLYKKQIIKGTSLCLGLPQSMSQPMLRTAQVPPALWYTSTSERVTEAEGLAQLLGTKEAQIWGASEQGRDIYNSCCIRSPGLRPQLGWKQFMFRPMPSNNTSCSCSSITPLWSEGARAESGERTHT